MSISELLFHFVEHENKKVLKVIVKTSNGLKHLLATFAELANGTVQTIKIDKSTATFVNFNEISFNLKKSSFCQSITKAKEKMIWEASAEDWKENMELTKPFLKGEMGHQYFGDYGTDILVEISFNE